MVSGTRYVLSRSIAPARVRCQDGPTQAIIRLCTNTFCTCVAGFSSVSVQWQQAYRGVNSKLPDRYISLPPVRRG